MASLNPTSSLADALARRRTTVRQSVVLGAGLAGCTVWWLASVPEPEPLLGLILVLGSCALLVDLALARAAGRCATACADELILSGFTCCSGHTPIERAIARRMFWLERPRARHRLAEHLRWRLRLADGTVSVSPGYLRASVLPPLVTCERRALLAEYPLVRKLADRLEVGPVDPRALVLLWSVVTTPPSLDRAVGRAAGEELTRRLRIAQAIIAPGGAGTAPGGTRALG